MFYKVIFIGKKTSVSFFCTCLGSLGGAVINIYITQPHNEKDFIYCCFGGNFIFKIPLTANKRKNLLMCWNCHFNRENYKWQQQQLYFLHWLLGCHNGNTRSFRYFRGKKYNKNYFLLLVGPWHANSTLGSLDFQNAENNKRKNNLKLCLPWHNH